MIRSLRLGLRLATGGFIALHASMAAGETLNLAVSHGPVSLAIYVAEAGGLFDKEGLTVKQLVCNSGRDCFRLMAEVSADVATAAELVATLNSFSRQDLAVIATISTSSHQIKFVARRSAGITVPAHLAGKRVGTVPGSSAQYFLDSWLLFTTSARSKSRSSDSHPTSSRPRCNEALWTRWSSGSRWQRTHCQPWAKTACCCPTRGCTPSISG